MNLETKHAQRIIGMLEDAQDIGMSYVVWAERPMERDLHPADLDFFDTMGAALDYWEDRANPGLPITEAYPVNYFRQVDRLLEELKQANGLTKQEDMNRNNLQNMQNDMTKLGFRKQTIEAAQQQMAKGLPEFQLHEQHQGNRGTVDVTAHFRQSGQSDNYYLNKFETALNTGKPLEEGQKYFVITPHPTEAGKNLSKSFVNVAEAVNFAKAQPNATLGIGKDAAHAAELASRVNGKDDYVQKDFQKTYRTPAQTQTFFVDRGKGFTVEQAANLIQGRAVFRDDLLNLGGDTYAAWIKLDFDSPKDRYQNYVLNQYHVPSYNFDIREQLGKYHIKEMADEKKAEKLVTAMENGNRPLITTEKDGQEMKLYLEASPRFRQLNFFREDRKPENREQFLKEPKLDQSRKLEKGKGQEKEQEQGLSV
jgi:hypothetical protein